MGPVVAAAPRPPPDGLSPRRATQYNDRLAALKPGRNQEDVHAEPGFVHQVFVGGLKPTTTEGPFARARARWPAGRCARHGFRPCCFSCVFLASIWARLGAPADHERQANLHVANAAGVVRAAARSSPPLLCPRSVLDTLLTTLRACSPPSPSDLEGFL
jgi:hypothetical protein